MLLVIYVVGAVLNLQWPFWPMSRWTINDYMNSAEFVRAARRDVRSAFRYIHAFWVLGTFLWPLRLTYHSFRKLGDK